MPAPTLTPSTSTCAFDGSGSTRSSASSTAARNASLVVCPSRTAATLGGVPSSVSPPRATLCRPTLTVPCQDHLQRPSLRLADDERPSHPERGESCLHEPALHARHGDLCLEGFVSLLRHAHQVRTGVHGYGRRQRRDGALPSIDDHQAAW